jgi:hypothetical protein
MHSSKKKKNITVRKATLPFKKPTSDDFYVGKVKDKITQKKPRKPTSGNSV